MIKRFTDLEFKMAKSEDRLPCECYECHNIYYKKKKYIQSYLKDTVNVHARIKYCNRKCHNKKMYNRIELECTQCKKIIYKIPSQITINNFCTKSCAVTYNNTHKTKGTRVSKLEKWLAEQLTVLYPNLEIQYNRKDTINSELDIYIPSLKLAFELNGIFHYEPIYGGDKLKQIQNNDDRKFQACLENGIELVIIDSSSLKYFKPERAKKYLNIITNILNSKLK